MILMYPRTVKVRSTSGAVHEYVRVVEAYRQDGKERKFNNCPDLATRHRLCWTGVALGASRSSMAHHVDVCAIPQVKRSRAWIERPNGKPQVESVTVRYTSSNEDIERAM